MHDPQRFAGWRMPVVETSLGIPTLFELVIPDQTSRSCKAGWRGATTL